MLSVAPFPSVEGRSPLKKFFGNVFRPDTSVVSAKHSKPKHSPTSSNPVTIPSPSFESPHPSASNASTHQHVIIGKVSNSDVSTLSTSEPLLSSEPNSASGSFRRWSPRVRSRHDTAVASTKLALKAAEAALKLAPVPGLDTIPSTLLLILETYQVRSSFHPTPVLMLMYLVVSRKLVMRTKGSHA